MNDLADEREGERERERERERMSVKEKPEMEPKNSCSTKHPQVKILCWSD